MATKTKKPAPRSAFNTYGLEDDPPAAPSTRTPVNIQNTSKQEDTATWPTSSFRFDPKLRHRLKVLAARQEREIGDLAGEAIREYLERNGG